MIEFYRESNRHPIRGWWLAFVVHADVLDDDLLKAIVEGEFDVELRVR